MHAHLSWHEAWRLTFGEKKALYRVLCQKHGVRDTRDRLSTDDFMKGLRR